MSGDDRNHLAGIVGAHLVGVTSLPRQAVPPGSPPLAPELLRPLQEYARVLGGAWRWLRKIIPTELPNDLEPMLTRLKLTAIRDQLDTLLDQAARAGRFYGAPFS